MTPKKSNPNDFIFLENRNYIIDSYHGIFVCRLEIGNIISQMFLRDSRTITQTISNGKITRERINSNYDDFDAMKFYDDEGNLQSFLRLYVDGDTRNLIGLDDNETEIRRINMNDEPQDVLKYRQYLSRL